MRSNGAPARSEIPIYLVIDPRDAGITLYSGPEPGGHSPMAAVPVGDKLDLPGPFGIVLDTGTTPRRPERSENAQRKPGR